MLPAVQSFYCKAVITESVGTLRKAKTKYLKLMYVYQIVRKPGYAYELNICDSIARFFTCMLRGTDQQRASDGDRNTSLLCYDWSRLS